MDNEQLRADVHNAIATALLGHERAMLGPWVLTAATTGEDGLRTVWVITSPDTVSYEAKGLLAEAVDRVREDGENYAWITDEDDELDED